MTTETRELVALEIFKDRIDEYTIAQASEVLGTTPNHFLELLGTARSNELESMVESSFQKQWVQMTESDRQEFLED